jgi:hypothetical protein
MCGLKLTLEDYRKRHQGQQPPMSIPRIDQNMMGMESLEHQTQTTETTATGISNQNQGKNLIVNYLSPDVQENALWVFCRRRSQFKK